MDNLFEQFTAISKAGAYDAIMPEYVRLQDENIQLKHQVATLQIMLKGEIQRVKALKDFINEVRPDNAERIPLGEVDQEIEDELTGEDRLKRYHAEEELNEQNDIENVL